MQFDAVFVMKDMYCNLTINQIPADGSDYVKCKLHTLNYWYNRCIVQVGSRITNRKQTQPHSRSVRHGSVRNLAA